MILKINDTTNIRELQWKFHQAFPFLKIEFFYHPYCCGAYADPADNKCHPDIPVPALILYTNPFIIKIQPWYKVGYIKETFEDTLGLHTKVYYRYGYEWIEADGYDNVCLEELNELGRRMICERKANRVFEREALL
jgi:hypothetical protein